MITVLFLHKSYAEVQAIAERFDIAYIGPDSEISAGSLPPMQKQYKIPTSQAVQVAKAFLAGEVSAAKLFP